MKADEYKETQISITSILLVIDTLDLNNYLDSINRCEAIAPLTNPEIFRQNCNKMQEDKEMAMILKSTQDQFRKMKGDR